MSLGIRGKLFLWALVLITIADVLVGTYLERGLHQSLRSNVQTELTRHAKSVGAMLETADTSATVDAIADRIADATGTHISIHDVDGRTLGDSSLTPIEIEQLTVPATESEMTEAATQGAGLAVRESAALDVEIMFVAVKIATPQGALVARASASLGGVESLITRQRWAVVLAGVLALGVAGVLLLVASSQVARTLQPVFSSAAAAVQASESADNADADSSTHSLQSIAVDLERTMGLLSKERNRFAAVLQTLEQAVLVLGPDQRLITVNRAAHSLLSLPEPSVGRTLLEAVRVPRLKRLAEQAAEGGTHNEEFDLPGGCRILARATRQSDDGVVLVAQDVTEIRRLERVRRDFVANVSHELRTPISVVKANAETLLDGGLEDQKVGRMFVEAIHRHADRLGRIVNDLLDISRIEAGRYPLAPAPLNVGEVVDHVLDLVEVDARKKNIELSVAVEPELCVIADRKAMEHILINLTSNAFKYTPDNGAVEVTAYPLEDGRVRVEVLDDGPGIDPAHRERIFERFFRADSGRSRDMGGTGLGLSIVKHLIDAHDGDVGVDPRSPRGSVFWFVLAAVPSGGSDAANDGPSGDSSSVG